jgi:hypothetical protein
MARSYSTYGAMDSFSHDVNGIAQLKPFTRQVFRSPGTVRRELASSH